MVDQGGRESNRIQTDVNPVREIPGWRHWVPLAFVVFSLFLLVLIPVLSENRNRAYRTMIAEVITPAAGHVADIKVALAIGGGAIRDFIVSRDPADLRRYKEALADQQHAVEALGPLVDRLGPRPNSRYLELERAINRWDAEVNSLLDRIAGRSRDVAMPQQDFYDDAVIAATVLAREITGETGRMRDRVRLAEQRALILSGGLTLLALLAAAVVGWVGRQVHFYAAASERARHELEQVTQSRTRLMRGFSHDVKNPLGAADGYAQLLEDDIYGPITAQQRDSVRRIRASIHTALDLIADLVELGRAETGLFEIRFAPLDLSHETAEAVWEYQAAATTKGIQLSFEAAPDLPRVVSDRQRVRQILSNLLSNAVKYTPAGGRVEVSLGVSPARREEDPEQWATITVRDSGPGIPREKLHLLFREFTRLEPDASEGAGLGLAISQRVAQALGGKITVESRDGAGSAFTLRLPHKAAARPERLAAG